jgi:choline dehydrogenase-like flavoprotein
VTAPHDPAPISSLVLESFQAKGLPLKPDLLSTGESPHACGHAVRTIYQGVRTTAVDFLKDESNLDILTGHYIDKVVVEPRDNGQITASGVQTKDAEGNSRTFSATKEVIVCAGAYGSPAILLRSGIGPKKELEEQHVTPTLDLPGVGKNLQDHMVCIQHFNILSTLAD